MEGILEPFVHYLPINEDMSNVEEVILWAENHPDETRLVAESSTLFIYDLLFHADAAEDEMLVIEGIMESYENNFGLGSMRQFDGNFFDELANERLARAERFPSVEERIAYYMGRWNDRNNSISMKRDSIEHLKATIPSNGVAKDAPFIASGLDLSQCSLDKGLHPKYIQQICMSALPHFDERNTADLKSNSFKRLLKTNHRRDIQYADRSCKSSL